MHERPEFSFDRPFSVSRPGGFTCNGRRYESGELFEWRELGLNDAEIWDLWVLGEVDNVPDAIGAPSAVEPERPCGPLAETAAPVDPTAPTADAAASVAPTRVVALPPATAPPEAAPAVRPAPSSPPKPVAAKGVTRLPQQNQLPRR